MWPHITKYEYVDDNNNKLSMNRKLIKYKILNFNNTEENKC